MDALVADAAHALAHVGTDPRAALAEADAVVARRARPRTPEEVREVATAHRAAGLALRATGDPVGAERRMRRGLSLAERGGDDELAAEVRMSLAFVLLETGRLRAALAAADHALGVLTGVPAARARTIRALVLQRSGRTREALADYDTALTVLHRAHDDVWEARLRSNRAQLYGESGDTAAALADLQWTRDHDLAVGSTVDAADALWNMGALLGMAGDVPAALELFDRAEAEWDGLERPENWLGRADILLGAGLVDEAAESARRAVQWLSARSWDFLEAEARLYLGLCLLTGTDVSEASVEASTARAMFARQDRPERAALAEYVVTKAALLRGPTVRDLDRTVRVASVVRDTGHEAHAADLRVTAGRAAIAAGDVRRARTLLGPLASQERVARLDVRSRSFYARALLAELGGDRAAADRALRRAWDVVEEQRSLLGATELRAGATTHATAIVQDGTRLAVASGSARSAFSWGELGRAAVLRYQPAMSPRDPDVARALARLRWAARTDEQLRAEGVHYPDAADTLRRTEAEVVRLTRQVAGSRLRLPPVNDRDVRPRLGDEVWLQLLVSDARWWAVTVDARRTRLTPLAEAAPVASALETLTFGLRRVLTGFGTDSAREATARATRRAADRLDELLLAPVGGLLGDADVVLGPSGPLSGVPWSLLATCRGRVVHVAPSATVWCRARDGERTTGPRVVVAVAGPGLDGARREVDDVAEMHPDALSLTGPDATVRRVLDEAAEADVLHLAAHGRLRIDNPLFSRLELADGPLTGYDLESLRRVPGTVVLSACSSGSGRATVGDETLGLAWTLMGLGCREVLAPLHPVPDRETRELMVSVHRHLRAGRTVAESLALCQQRVDPADVVGSAVAASFVAFGA